MRLESGPARADRNWQLLRTILFLGFALWFVYDGAVRWPNKNRAEAEKVLAGHPFKGRVTFDQLGETPTGAEFQKLLELVKSKPLGREQVYEILGKPQLTEGTDEYFASRYGYAQVTVQAGTVRHLQPEQWKPWYKDKDQVRGQFYWAILPAVPGLYFLWRLIRAVTLRVVIDDEGMVYAGRRIPFASMTSLRDYNPKGWIDLYYTVGTRAKRLRLDNEKVALFDQIVDAICQAKGFRNEVREYAERRAREEAEQTPPEDSPVAGSQPSAPGEVKPEHSTADSQSERQPPG